MNPIINNKKWYVYTLNDPETSIPFYVGKGQRYRMYNHYYNVKKHKIPNGNFRLYEKIKSIITNGKSIEYKIVFSSDNEKKAYDREFQLIQEIGIDNLCNLFLGYGKSYSGEKHWNYGRTTPQNVKDKIGKSKLGDKHTEESKMKMSKQRQGDLHPMFGRHHTDDTRKQMSKNHADFNGKNNPFYQKSHNDKTKEYLHDLFSKPVKIIFPNNEYVVIYGQKNVKKYVNDYNINNNTKVSAFSLFQYGKNGDGWKLEKLY
jgi:NUMOD3 motif